MKKDAWKLREVYMLLRDWYGTDFADVEICAHTPEAKPVSSLLDGVLAKASGPDGALIARLQQEWPHIFGAALAKHSRLVRFQGVAAVIEVDHSAWMVELNRMKSVLLAKLNTAIGRSRCTELRFIPAGRS